MILDLVSFLFAISLIPKKMTNIIIHRLWNVFIQVWINSVAQVEVVATVDCQIVLVRPSVLITAIVAFKQARNATRDSTTNMTKIFFHHGFTRFCRSFGLQNDCNSSWFSIIRSRTLFLKTPTLPVCIPSIVKK